LRNKQTGMVHLIESRSSPLRDESGAVGAAVGLIRDRTPELKAEHAAALMESITASSDDAYIALARDGKVSGWNPAAVRMFGYEPEEIIGHACRRLISDRMIGHTREITQRMLDGGGPERFELEVLRKDGSSLPVLIEVFPAAETPNQRTVFMVICRDRSGRKAIEAEAAKARAMAEESARRHFDFLINMSQELTASINRISAVMPLLLESPLQAQQREYVRAAASGSEELLETVSQVLYLAQLAAGQVVFEQNEFDLYETVEGAMDAAAERGQSKDIELVLAVGPELPRRLIGDGRRTAQALATLVESAVRFNDQGEVVVSVDCEERGADYTVVRFEVRDTGAGMPPEMKARLFQPFAGLEARTGRGRADTGLGLAIAARLIERMGSSAISADGESGHGSVFRYTLRFANVPGPAAQPDGWGQLAPHRVLVADDNSANRVSVCRQLALWGLAPDSAIGGAEALMAIRQRAAAGTPYDLVLADMRMPGMDGFALARAIKSDPRLKDARLVMMGPYGVPEQPDTDGWLVKPIKPTRLLACLQAIAGSAGTDRGGIADGGIGVAAREGASPANVSGVIGHASPADYESLDSSVLAELRALASDDEGRVVDGLINTFMRELQPRLAQLEMALSSGDMAGLAALAKSLRARSAGLGLTRMAALCADLSASGQNSDRRPPAIILASLRDEAARLGPLLERQRAAAPAEVAA
jgi:PAS domain S-box-containing protein